MKNLSITIAILFVIFAMACDRSPKTNAIEKPLSKSASEQSVPAQSQASEAGFVYGENPSGSAPYAASEVAAAEGMNPPHGQPNHRCDIAVGVPLDSPPGTGKSTPTVSTQSSATAKTTTTPSTAQGMNPPHGQPNHRCDIAVGALLDSPAGTGKQQSPTVVSQNDVTPKTATEPTTPGTNPPHGQPGHVCDHGQPGHVCAPPTGAPLNLPSVKTK